ncbi:MAG: lytic transglycosylase domain-containing protein [Mesorhizobium sp.]|nr:MAG: lytic transglycosylase domain-containing protein [Mesorhizobium sp.]
MCAIIPSEANASEPAEQPVIRAEKSTSNGQQWVASFSSDNVAEARWARPQREYLIGEQGRIVPGEGSAEAVTPDKALALKGGHSGRFFSDEAAGAVAGCGPSPATPEDITRLVVEAAKRHEVDVDFAIAVAIAESRLDRLRNSPKGARGPMQLMPDTAERFGVTDICDPEQNIDGGVRYLRELANEFRNPLLVAAAYNAGEGRVREHAGIPPFKETLAYVAEVLNVQMELDGSGPIAREPGGSADEQQPVPNTSGVIPSRERRQWVGGVMHF